jgi:tRNA(Ser,Leu) C12 N-acetylase TAN1
MKPTLNHAKRARVKGGRANGGTRYFHSKLSGEDKIVRLMQSALDNDVRSHGKSKLSDLTTSKLIKVLEISCERTTRVLKEINKKCSEMVSNKTKGEENGP